MRLVTPDSLHYPITITRLLRKTDDDVQNTDPLFDYEYRTTVIEGSDENKEGAPVEKRFPSTFQSYVEGKLDKWLIQPGMVIVRPRTPIVDIEEPCRHEVQFGGICANCGKDMTTVDYNTATRDTARATVNTVHGHTALLVSAAEASRSDEEAKRRLLSSRRLSLVVDLDQTIIHATVDPTVGEWQNDPSNPNYESVKDVRAFQLADDVPGARGCWYYIKLRPGLKDFLDVISKIYECHIYTMGTRAYAQNIAKIVDPQRKIFGDRILSRDESGSMTIKSLKRLFPVDTKMVVIIDDRGDVWQWSQNLIKVTPYDFFVGIGDINSSFLPKRPGIDVAPPPTISTPAGDADKPVAQVDKAEPTSGGDKSTETKQKPTRPISDSVVQPQANGDVSAIEQLMSMSGSNDATKLQEQATAQDETLVAQLTDRPLLQKQKILDAHEEAAANGDGSSTLEQDGSSEAHHEGHSKYRHNLLEDNDTELAYLQQSLQTVHKTFFDEYDRKINRSQGGRVSELARPGQSKKRSIDDLDDLPNVTTIMGSMKTRVLKGVHLVFTGVVPLGIDIHSHDLAIWATSFGATVSDNISKRTTHVIASPARRTAKVRQAARHPDRISIVNQQWLFDCVARWQHVREQDYKIHLDALDEESADRNKESHGTALLDAGSSPFDDPIAENGVLSSSEDEGALTEDDADGAPQANGLLSVRTRFDGVGGGGDTDVDTDGELERHMPALSREDSSPHEQTKEDWDGMNDELAEFLGSDGEGDDDDDDDDNDDGDGTDDADDTDRGARTDAAGPGRSNGLKRKRTVAFAGGGQGDGTSSADDSEADSVTADSKLQRRKRKALARSTGLSSSSVPTPGGGDAGGRVGALRVADGEAEAEATDDDLEAELAAEMARQAAEEDGDGDGAVG